MSTRSGQVQATLAVVHDAVPAPRRPHDVISLTERSGHRSVRAGPTATGKWIYGSVIESAQQVIGTAFDQAEARDGTHARTWVVLVDGDPHQIQLLQAEAARRAVAIYIVCDLIHVLEYCWRGARSLHTATTPRPNTAPPPGHWACWPGTPTRSSPT
ncbi:hypothetical protein [Carbonactinospora thermoautotrophica]|uniref:hypothetical protein n=1 Tax=Carbonactinospora thermoautotrophica TaxID=1469144 RepID=UPI00226E1D01|nr:hypothetical protein [Carbonactinospora thermoautotrophica]